MIKGRLKSVRDKEELEIAANAIVAITKRVISHGWMDGKCSQSKSTPRLLIRHLCAFNIFIAHGLIIYSHTVPPLKYKRAPEPLSSQNYQTKQMPIVGLMFKQKSRYLYLVKREISAPALDRQQRC